MKCGPSNDDGDDGSNGGGGGVDCDKWPNRIKCRTARAMDDCNSKNWGRNMNGRSKCKACTRKGGRLMKRSECSGRSY